MQENSETLAKSFFIYIREWHSFRQSDLKNLMQSETPSLRIALNRTLLQIVWRNSRMIWLWSGTLKLGDCWWGSFLPSMCMLMTQSLVYYNTQTKNLKTYTLFFFWTLIMLFCNIMLLATMIIVKNLVID